MMLYSIILVESKETLEVLSHTCDEQPFIKTASFALIFLVDYQKMYDYFADNNFHSYCLEQDQKPVYPGLSDLLLGSQDAMAAAQNSVIAAESLGVGSCYIGDIIENYETHRELFNLKDLSFPLSMIVFGNYPDGYKPKIQSRFDEQYVLFQEKYRSLTSEELHDMYQEREAKFQPKNPFEAKNAAQVMYAQKIGSEFGLEMKRSVNEMYKRWINPKYEDE
jgi:nitroreductase